MVEEEHLEALDGLRVLFLPRVLVTDHDDRYSYLAVPDTPTEVRRLMRLEGPHKLALHVDRLGLADGDADLAYATILEAHHPEYLDAAAVREIYAADAPAGLADEHLTQFTDLLFDR